MSAVTRAEAIPIPVPKHRHKNVLFVDAGSNEGGQNRRHLRTRRSSEGQACTGSEGRVSDSGVTAGTLSMLDPACEQSADVASLIATNLQRLCCNAEGSQPSMKLTPFHGVRAPPISLENYLKRIAQYTKCSPACFVLAVAYMDAMWQREADIGPCALTVHRIMLVGTLLATKLYDDKRYSNQFWARVGGISLHELNALELESLRLLDYKLMVSPEVTRRYIRQLQSNTFVLGGEAGSFHRESIGRKRRSMTGSYASSGGGSSPGSERNGGGRVWSSVGSEGWPGGGFSRGGHSIKGQRRSNASDNDSEGAEAAAALALARSSSGGLSMGRSGDSVGPDISMGEGSGMMASGMHHRGASSGCMDHSMGDASVGGKLTSGEDSDNDGEVEGGGPMKRRVSVSEVMDTAAEAEVGGMPALDHRGSVSSNGHRSNEGVLSPPEHNEGMLSPLGLEGYQSQGGGMHQRISGSGNFRKVSWAVP